MLIFTFLHFFVHCQGAEVQPKSDKTAAYVESHVSGATWRSFVVECKEDYNLLYRELREKRNIPVNMIVVNNGRLESNNRMYSDGKMDVLRKEHGFIGYLDETFTAPDPIMQALINNHKVDKVIVGGEEVQKSLEQKGLIEFLCTRGAHDNRPGKVASCFYYTNKNASYKYISQPLRYTGEVGTLSYDIRPAQLLRPGSDPRQKDELAEAIRNTEETIERFRPKTNEGKNQIEKFNLHSQEILVQCKKIESKVIDKMNSVLQSNRKHKGNPKAAVQSKLDKLQNSTSEENLQMEKYFTNVISEKDNEISLLKLTQFQQIKYLTKIIAEKDKEISHLKVDLENPKPIDTVDLTCDNTANSSTATICSSNHSSKCKRTENAPAKSSLAFSLEQNQANIRVKKEAQERAITAERKAAAAVRDKEAYEMKLECPYCSELDKQRCVLKPCGHEMCHDCSLIYATTKCPVCNTNVMGQMMIFK